MLYALPHKGVPAVIRCALRPLILIVLGLVFGALFAGRAASPERRYGREPTPGGDGEVQPF